MTVKRLLALIPRGLVERIPREKRDAWRTALLTREREWRMRSSSQTQPAPGPDGTEAPRHHGTKASSRDAHVERRLANIEVQLQAVSHRLDEVAKAIEQLDSRISVQSSGDAPSAIDDLRELIAPIEALRTQLLDSSADSAEAPAPDLVQATSSRDGDA